MAIDIRRVTRLAIGIQTEEGAEVISFDVSPWKKEYPGLTTFQLNITPPDGGNPYIAATHMEGDCLVWPIAAQDTAIPGKDGWYEIEAVGSDVHKLAPRRQLIVYPRMNGAVGPAPEPMESWLSQAAEIRDETVRAALRAEEAADRAGSGGNTGGSGSGADGRDGGYYVPNVDASGRLTWTASQSGMPGIASASIMGPQGEKGDKGDTGPAGADGKTPARGTDYWTAADVAQIKSYVDEAILGGAW